MLSFSRRRESERERAALPLFGSKNTSIFRTNFVVVRHSVFESFAVRLCLFMCAAIFVGLLHKTCSNLNVNSC